MSLESSVFKLSCTNCTFVLQIDHRGISVPTLCSCFTPSVGQLLLTRNSATKLKSNAKEEQIDHSATVRINTLITIASPSLGHPEKAKRSSTDLCRLTFPNAVGKNILSTQHKGSGEPGRKKDSDAVELQIKMSSHRLLCCSAVNKMHTCNRSLNLNPQNWAVQWPEM